MGVDGEKGDGEGSSSDLPASSSSLVEPVGELCRQLPENVITCLDSAVKKCFESLRDAERTVEEGMKDLERTIEDLKKELPKRKSPVEFEAKDFAGGKSTAEAQIREAPAEVEKKQRDLEVRAEELITRITELQERVESVDAKQQRIEQIAKDVEEFNSLKRVALGRGVEGSRAEFSSWQTMEGAHLQLLRVMNGDEVQMFLNEGYHLVKEDVARFLPLASDPAKLVLDAVQGFYPPHLKKGGVAFEAHVVRRSCNFLLEELAYLAPKISPSTKTEAQQLLDKWIEKVGWNELDEVLGVQLLGFLWLITAYGLQSNNDDTLLVLMLHFATRAASHSQAVMLLKRLGLAQQMEADIEELAEEGLNAEAERLKVIFRIGDDMEEEE